MPQTLEMKVDPKAILQHTLQFLEETIGRPLTKDDVAYLKSCLGLYGQGCRQEGRAESQNRAA